MQVRADIAVAGILSHNIEGDSCEVGKARAAFARVRPRMSAKAWSGKAFSWPFANLSSAGITVTVISEGGRVGHASEFRRSCAIAVTGELGVHVLAADTERNDGIDRIEDNAGCGRRFTECSTRMRARVAMSCARCLPLQIKS